MQQDFLKQARKWDDLSYEEQKGYLSRHPKTKRKITAKPDVSQSKEEEPKVEKELQQEQNVGKMNKSNETKIVDLFKPLFEKHEDYLQKNITEKFNTRRKRFLTQFPQKPQPEDLRKTVLLLDYPNNDRVKDFVNSILYNDYTSNI